MGKLACVALVFAFCTASLCVWAAPGRESEPATRPVGLTMAVQIFPAAPPNRSPIVLRFTNNTQEPITVCQPLDGSEVGWRVASYTWTVTDSAGNAVARRPMGRCGNVNGLKVEDFVTIPPGKTVHVGAGFLSSPAWSYDMSKPGTYHLQLTYAFSRTDPEGGLAFADAPGTEALVERAWEGTVTSAPVEFEVKAGQP